MAELSSSYRRRSGFKVYKDEGKFIVMRSLSPLILECGHSEDGKEIYLSVYCMCRASVLLIRTNVSDVLLAVVVVIAAKGPIY